MSSPCVTPAVLLRSGDPENVSDMSQSNSAVAQRPSVEPPGRGPRIGASLALCITVVLVVVLGGLSAVQLHREARQEKTARQALLAESLAPLAVEIFHSAGLDEIRRRLEAYQQAFVVRGHADHQVALLDTNGKVIACSTCYSGAPPKHLLSASIEIEAPVLTAGKGTLRVWQDGSGLAAELARRRRLAWFDIVVTGLILGLGVQIILHILVSRPLKQLLISIEKIENGYLHSPPNTNGAWEFQRLAWRFHEMGAELTQGARLLVAAQRRAMMLTAGGRSPAKENTVVPLPIADPSQPKTDQTILRRYLHDRCTFLESCSPGDSAAEQEAVEAWEYDVVEAERLGDIDLKARLGNAALKILDPEAYQTVSLAVDELHDSRADWCVDVENALSEAFEEQGVHCLSIQHRVKHVAGVWRKMQEKHLAIDEVHDALAFRAVVHDRDDCYLALDAVHRLFEPEPFRFKDYISRPKGNGYRSIHTTVRDTAGFPFEVQIRSVQMHEEAERGEASHWSYLAQKNDNGRKSSRYLRILGSVWIPKWGREIRILSPVFRAIGAVRRRLRGFMVRRRPDSN